MSEGRGWLSQQELSGSPGPAWRPQDAGVRAWTPARDGSLVARGFTLRRACPRHGEEGHAN